MTKPVLEVREDSYGEWRMLAEVDGYVMARRKGAFPCVFPSDAWRRMPLRGSASRRRIILEDISIGAAGLSGKAVICAERGGFATLWDVDQASDAELLRIPALGRNTLRELRLAVTDAVETPNDQAR